MNSPDTSVSRTPRYAAALWAWQPEAFEPHEISLAVVRTLATEAGLAVSAVTSAEPFISLQSMLEGHIEAGRLAGLDWFDIDRASFASNPRRLHGDARSVISLGLPYYSGPAEKPADVPRGRIARYAWGVDYHRIFRGRLRTFLELLEAHIGCSIEARLLADTARIVDRAVAVRSGLGWYGKNSCVIVPGHGSWVMLGEAIVDIDIERSAPIDHDCGRCSQCLDRCPTGAIVAPYTVDTPRCLSFQTIEQRGAIPIELRPLLGDWVFGCDVCQEVCPYTAAASLSDDPDFGPESIERVFPRLEFLLNMSEAEFRITFARSSVIRAKRRGLARNAAVALGNSGDPDAGPLLTTALLQHDEPLVRGHAAWALGFLGGGAGHEALKRAAQSEPDDMVQKEIESALSTANFS